MSREKSLLRSAAAFVMRMTPREPLLHFLAIGAVIFGMDVVLHPPAKDEKVIVVTKALQKSFIEGFDEDKERAPSESTLSKMIDAWVASEILYREGKTLGVDRGDEMIRDRIAFKLQLLIFDQVKVERPTEAELAAWFAANHAQFDEPELVGFYLTPASDEATARRLLDDIEAQHESEDLHNQTRAILARPVDSLAPSFGDAFRDALLALPLEKWSVIQSKEGWHVVRLDSRRPGKVASLDEFRDEAIRRRHVEETRKQAWEAVNRLKTSYKERIEK